MVPHRNIIPAAKAEKAAGEEDAVPVDLVVVTVADPAAVMVEQAAAADIAVIVVVPAVGEAIAAATEVMAGPVATADREVTAHPAVMAAAERSRQSQSGLIKLNRY